MSSSGALLSTRQDRYARSRPIASATSAFKISAQDAQDAFFVIDHNNHNKGGPPRHLHHNEDEWFCVIEGEYLVQVGPERHRLKSGDSILGPRGVPHAWAFLGNSPGWLLRAYIPAGKMQSFFAESKKRARHTAYSADAALYRACGMELLGPPLLIG